MVVCRSLLVVVVARCCFLMLLLTHAVDGCCLWLSVLVDCWLLVVCCRSLAPLVVLRCCWLVSIVMRVLFVVVC